MKTIRVAFILLLAGYAISYAQTEYCDTVAITHGHGPITVTGISVDDPDVFRVEILRATPFELGDGASFDVRLCILRRDGKTYRTKIRYQTSHGEFAVDASLIAPDITSSVITVDEAQWPRVLVYPTPARDRISVMFNRTEPVPLILRLYDAGGALVRTMVLKDAPAPLGGVPFDVRGVCTGSYRLTVEIAGAIVAGYPVLIIR